MLFNTDGAHAGATPEARWLGLPVLNHAHGHPVARVHVLPDEVLEHDERLHQEVLQKAELFKKPSTPVTPHHRDRLHLSPSGWLFKCLLYCPLEGQIGEGSGFG